MVAYLNNAEKKRKRKIEEVTSELKKYHEEKGTEELIKSEVINHNKRPKKQMNIAHIFNPDGYRNRALSAQAHFFLYSKSSIPLTVFDDPLFKDMLRAMIPPNCSAELNNPPILNRYGVSEYISSEFDVMRSSLNKELAPIVEESRGNQFCQMIHDGITLGNKSKYQSFGLQFTC